METKEFVSFFLKLVTWIVVPAIGFEVATLVVRWMFHRGRNLFFTLSLVWWGVHYLVALLLTANLLAFTHQVTNELIFGHISIACISLVIGAALSTLSIIKDARAFSRSSLLRLSGTPKPARSV